MKQLIYKLIYQQTINRSLRSLNKLILPLLPKKFRLPPSGVLTLNLEGQILKIKTNQTSYLTHLVFWNGYMNYEYTKIFLGLIKKMNSFFDVGANIGYYSLLAALQNPEMKIISFEPASGPLAYLKDNVRINHFFNIKVEPIALSEKTGEIEFNEFKSLKYAHLDHTLAGLGSAGNMIKSSNYESYKVPTLTLDEYVLSNNMESVDLIKLDTEGTEHLILEHSDYVLGQMQPIIICETLFNGSEKRLEEVIKKYGYEFYNFVNGDLKKTASIQRTEDSGVRDCFFVTPNKAYLIEEFITK